MQFLNGKRLEMVIFFAICAAAVVWVTVAGSIATSCEIVRLILLAVLFLVIKLLFMKRISSPTGSGAIVMAIGIFINGTIGHFPFFDKELARSLTMILFLLLLFIAGSYFLDAVQRKVFRMHFADHVGGFAVGTWIAGVSVCGVALCGRLPDWKPLVQVLVIGNIALWFYFVYR